MNGYEEAEVIAARASASLMGFIESPEGDPTPDDVDGADKITEFEPGVFKTLAPGEKVNVPDLKRPSGQFDPFMVTMLRAVAAGIGDSYESLTADYSKSNYSSTRQSLISVRDNWKVLQSWFIENFHKEVYREWLDLAVLSGEIKIPKYELNPEKFQDPTWLPRGWQWVDPSKDIDATKEAIKAGLNTQTNALAETGQDFETIVKQRKREKQIAEKNGLKFDVNELDQSPKQTPKNNNEDSNLKNQGGNDENT
jgi:lambda family phage portal protein